MPQILPALAAAGTGIAQGVGTIGQGIAQGGMTAAQGLGGAAGNIAGGIGQAGQAVGGVASQVPDFLTAAGGGGAGGGATVPPTFFPAGSDPAEVARITSLGQRMPAGVDVVGPEAPMGSAEAGVVGKPAATSALGRAGQMVGRGLDRASQIANALAPYNELVRAAQAEQPQATELPPEFGRVEPFQAAPITFAGSDPTRFLRLLSLQG